VRHVLEFRVAAESVRRFNAGSTLTDTEKSVIADLNRVNGDDDALEDLISQLGEEDGGSC
jgi:hypothetical protein